MKIQATKLPLIYTPLLALLLVLLASCGKAPVQQSNYQPAFDPDPEQGAENQLRLLLAAVNKRENELTTLVRAGGKSLTPLVRDQASAERARFYEPKQFSTALRGAQASIHDKMLALASERAAFADSVVSNLSDLTNAMVLNSNLPPDERSEEIILKSRLFDLQDLQENLAITSSSDLPAQTREKAATVRANAYSPETYVAGLSAAIDLLEKKLQGLDAEAAVYENLLGLTPVTHSSKVR